MRNGGLCLSGNAHGNIFEAPQALQAAGGLTEADAGASRRFQTHPGSKSALAAQLRPGLAHLGQFPVGVSPVLQELPEQLPALLPTTPVDLVMLSPNSWGIVQNQKSSIIQTLPAMGMAAKVT